MLMAQSLDSELHVISGPAVEKGDLAAVLTNLAAKDVLFIDEIHHRMHISVEEILYSAMEDFKLDILISKVLLRVQCKLILLLLLW